jgi:hypothetical protein
MPARKPLPVTDIAEQPKRTFGNRRGSPNRFSAELKEMIWTALEMAGGARYLHQQALERPVAFMNLLGKTLPYQATGPESGPVTINITKYGTSGPTALSAPTITAFTVEAEAVAAEMTTDQLAVADEELELTKWGVEDE